MVACIFECARHTLKMFSQVHFKYYAALMQHMRFKGISWFGDTVVSSYLRAEAAATHEVGTHGGRCI